MVNDPRVSEVPGTVVGMDVTWISDRARELMAAHLDGSWTFAFDRARTRAGLCRHDRRRISVSRELTGAMSPDQIDQVLLHEIAHALAGPDAHHGPQWRRIAMAIGCTGERVVDVQAAQPRPWVGTCPRGHTLHRIRRPAGIRSCGRCSHSFDERFVISWARTDPATG